MDLSQYRNLFVSESRIHLDAFNGLVLSLEEAQLDHSVIDELFRHAHSLKGMAATMQYHGIATLAHKVEDLLSLLRSAEIVFTPDMADVLLEAVDFLGEMISAVESGNESSLPDSALLLERLLLFSVSDAVQPHQTHVHAVDKAVAVASKQLPFLPAEALKTVRIKTEVLDRLVNITGELITTRHHLSECTRKMTESGADEPMKRLSVLLRDLRDEVLQARMLPFSYVSDRFPRLIRDLSRSQGKSVSLSVSGQEIELDRGILEEISDPMAHILRNAIDHGMETTGERSATGKPPTGNIRVTIQRNRDQIVISVADDGKGMDPENILARAVEKGIITADTAAALTPHEAFMLVCSPGFSTVNTVNEISGRGVGMDAVKNAVHKLGGSLSIDSQKGQGSCFLLKLPVSVSIINALLVKSGQLTVAFAINSVERTLEILQEDIRDNGCCQACLPDGETIPIRSLNNLLGQPESDKNDSHISVVVSLMNSMPVGLSCDSIIGQQEIFVKPLGAPLSQMNCFSGGAIMGDGQIVFVIDTNIQ